MPPYDLAQGALERVDVQHSANPCAQRHVVGTCRAGQLVEKPEALLREAARGTPGEPGLSAGIGSAGAASGRRPLRARSTDAASPETVGPSRKSGNSTGVMRTSSIAASISTARSESPPSAKKSSSRDEPRRGPGCRARSARLLPRLARSRESRPSFDRNGNVLRAENSPIGQGDQAVHVQALGRRGRRADGRRKEAAQRCDHRP